MNIDTANNAVMEAPTASEVDEPQLIGEISDLWRIHVQTQGALRKSREDIKQIRSDLAKRLHELKAVLSRPGRGGAWSSFLETQKIPRSTADRLVRGHEKTIAGQDGNCTTEQISEPNEVVVRRYCRGLWPRLSRVLTNADLVELFVIELWRTAESAFDSVSSKLPVNECES
jgi:hypothetical protein